MMNKTVLITGGSGFIGANIVRRFIRNGADVHIIVRKDANIWRIKDLQKKLTIYRDILPKKSSLTALFKKIEPYAVFHLAIYGSYPSQKSSSQMININLCTTLSLLESLIHIPVKRIIIAGSSSEYGKKYLPMRETDALEPNNMYGATKAAQTLVSSAFAKIHNKPVTILRLFNVYGYYEEKGRLVRSVIESALKNEIIKLATGEEARDLIFTEDIADAFIAAMESESAFGEIFNIGTGRQTTIKQLAEQVIKLTKSSSKISFNAYQGRVWDSTHWVADMTKTHKTLHWKAKYSLSDGLKKTIEWYRKYGHINN